MAALSSTIQAALSRTVESQDPLEQGPGLATQPRSVEHLLFQIDPVKLKKESGWGRKWE